MAPSSFTTRPAGGTAHLPATLPLAEFVRGVNTEWPYPRAEKRDRRLDLLRGLAVLVMVVDHFGGSSWLYLITGNNQFFTSGAEAFVLISGMVVGLVYRGVLVREGFKAAALKALARAFVLYRLTVVMTLGMAAVSVLFQLPWSRGVDLGDPLQFTLNVIILHETYYLADIPMMYAVFMALVPTGLWLLYKNRTGWLLALSFLVWLGFQWINAEQIMIWPMIGNTTFHPAAWQLIFAWAMAVGYHRHALWTKLGQIPRWLYLGIASVLFLLLLDLYSPELDLLESLVPGFREVTISAQLFNKSNVAPGRIFATIIVFQFLYLLLTNFWTPIRKGVGWFLEPLGQNSLYSYTMHVVVIVLFYIAYPYLPAQVVADGTVNTFLQLGALAIIWLMIRRRFLFRLVPR